MTHIETIHVADVLACAVDGNYHDGLDAFLSAGATIAQTGRVSLLVVVTVPADTPDEEETQRIFRFLGEEVRG